MSYAEVGIQFGIANGLSAAMGSLLAGRLADRLSNRDERWRLWIPGLSVLLSLPFLSMTLLWPDSSTIVLWLIPAGVIGGGWAPPVYSAIQNLVPAPMRAVAASVLIFFITLLGMGAGPQAVGILNDVFEGTHGEAAVRVSLLTVLSTSILGGLLFFHAARTLPGDLAREPGARGA